MLSYCWEVSMKSIKVICAILSFVLIELLTSCGSLPSQSERLMLLNSNTATEKVENLQMSQDVIKSINGKDTQGLKALFCLKTQELTDIDDQILACFDFIKGAVTSFDEKNITGYEGETIKDGEISYLERSWRIKDIVTDEKETYEIYINQFRICENDKRREGISQITITNSDNTEMVVGYRWPNYDNKGREMSAEIIKKSIKKI